MTLPVVILRPPAGARKTRARAEEIGLQTAVYPLFRIEPIDWSPPPVSKFDALLLTSANALEYAGPSITRYQKLPVLAVGKATATAARKAGFVIQEIGSSNGQELLNSLNTGQYPRILRLTGKHHTLLSVPGSEVCNYVVYQSLALELGQAAQDVLAGECMVLLHSPRAARMFVVEMERLVIDKGNCHIAALSRQVESAAGQGWKTIHAASEPTDDALLSLTARLCFGRASKRSPNEPGL